MSSRCFVRPGHVCSERDRELLASSSLPQWDPAPGTQPGASPHRPPGPIGMVPASSSFGSPSSISSIRKYGSLQKPAWLQKSEQRRGVKTEGHKEKSIPDNVRQFVLKHYAEAQKLADSLGNGVTAAEVLAVAGNESKWGSLDPKDRSLAQFGNFFGLHGPASGSTGTYKTKENSTPTPIFPLENGFMLSGQEFVSRVFKKKLMTPGIGADPKAFFKALNSPSPVDKTILYAATNPHYAEMMIRNDPNNRGHTHL